MTDEAKPDEAQLPPRSAGPSTSTRSTARSRSSRPICQIPLLDPGVIERVLQKDTLVCGSQNPRAFDKLRSLLMMHYSVRDRAVVALGEQETMLIMNEIIERLRSRYGDRLGRPAA